MVRLFVNAQYDAILRYRSERLGPETGFPLQTGANCQPFSPIRQTPGPTVRYVPERDAIEIVTSRIAGFLIPRQWIEALPDVPIEELSKLEVWPNGSAIKLEDREIQISVQGLLTAMLPLQSVARRLCQSRRSGDLTREAQELASQRP